MKEKILIVDDEYGIRMLLNDYFQLSGYETETAANGKEALEKAIRQPDLILLDINLPDIDGMTICRKIREEVKCPILFLTAKIEEQDKINGLLYGGDDYITYEDAMEEYQNLNEKDKITGGYARLFCDYMGIILGILPVFVVVTRELRDKRAKMKELVFVRKASSFTIIMSRYVSMCLMMFLPVLLISFYPLAECVGFAQGKGVNVQYTAFIIYSFGWLLPSILAVTGLGMFLTELTETAAAILVQGAWWFVSIFSGTAFMGGGNYGMNLIPRHNTQFNYLGFKEDFSSLVLNRSFYAALGIALVIAAVMVFEAKRKGKLKYGKMSGNRKGKHKASFADSVSC